MVCGKLIDPIDIQSREDHRLYTPMVIQDRITEIDASPGHTALNLIIADGERLLFERLTEMAGGGNVLAV